MPNITIRMPDQLIAKLDERIVNSTYRNRSELIRDLCRRYVEGLLIPIRIPPKGER